VSRDHLGTPINSLEESRFCYRSNDLVFNWCGVKIERRFTKNPGPLSKGHSSGVISSDSAPDITRFLKGSVHHLEMDMTLKRWPMRHLLVTIISSVVYSIFSAGPGQAQFTRYPAQPGTITTSDTILAGPPARRPIKQPLQVPHDGFWAVCFSIAGQCLVRGEAHIGSGAKCSCGVDPGYTR
jgi:hypothetical protein